MKNNSKTIVSGNFKSEKDLFTAIEWLNANGIEKTNMNILISNKNPNQDFKIKTLNKIPETTIKGLTAGIIAGGILGSLYFLGIIIIPTVGIAIAGPIIGATAGITLGALTGSLLGAAVGFKQNKYEAVFFDEKPDKSILLVIKADKSMKNIIKNKLKSIGASNIAIIN